MKFEGENEGKRSSQANYQRLGQTAHQRDLQRVNGQREHDEACICTNASNTTLSNDAQQSLHKHKTAETAGRANACKTSRFARANKTQRACAPQAEASRHEQRFAKVTRKRN